MIVVIGHPIAVPTDSGVRPGGTAAGAATAATRAGANVQVVGKVGDDTPGDQVVLALGVAGVGHVALLRDPARPTPLAPERRETAEPELDAAADAMVGPADADRPVLEAADVELGLRYLTDYRAIVVAEPLPKEVVRVAAEAASYAGAELVVVTDDATEPPADLPAGAVVLGSGGAETGEAFASLLGQVAAAIDAGATAADALQAAVGRLGASRPE